MQTVGSVRVTWAPSRISAAFSMGSLTAGTGARSQTCPLRNSCACKEGSGRRPFHSRVQHLSCLQARWLPCRAMQTTAGLGASGAAAPPGGGGGGGGGGCMVEALRRAAVCCFPTMSLGASDSKSRLDVKLAHVAQLVKVWTATCRESPQNWGQRPAAAAQLDLTSGRAAEPVQAHLVDLGERHKALHNEVRPLCSLRRLAGCAGCASWP